MKDIDGYFTARKKRQTCQQICRPDGEPRDDDPEALFVRSENTADEHETTTTNEDNSASTSSIARCDSLRGVLDQRLTTSAQPTAPITHNACPPLNSLHPPYITQYAHLQQPAIWSFPTFAPGYVGGLPAPSQSWWHPQLYHQPWPYYQGSWATHGPVPYYPPPPYQCQYQYQPQSPPRPDQPQASSPQPQLFVPPFQGFRICTPRHATKPEKLIRQKLESMERKPGTLYVFSRDSDPGFVKIGCTSASVKRRLQEWKSKCRYHPRLIHTVSNVPFARRVEKLIHLDLIEYRRKEKVCRYNPLCGQVHSEWFEIDVRRVKETMKKWVEWVRERRPYEGQEDKDGDGDGDGDDFNNDNIVETCTDETNERIREIVDDGAVEEEDNLV